MNRSTDTAVTENPTDLTVPAGLLAPWRVAELPEPPRPGWRLWIGLIGPGVVLAGTSIGSGEWLFGPVVSAQYGATFLWLATLSIVLQVFCNLMMMRYTLYCGEPILVGGLRTWPGPLGCIIVYALFDFAGVWPYNASNAAVPLAAAILGHLPGDNPVHLLGQVITEHQLVRVLGIAIFLLAFVPLIFGGTIYRMLEKIMSIKLVLILGYLTFVAVFLVPPSVAWQVVKGFVGFGEFAQRAATIIVDPHFGYSTVEGGRSVVVKGVMEHGHPMVAEFLIDGVKQPKQPKGAELALRELVVGQALELMRPNSFLVETAPSDGTALSISGQVTAGRWLADSFKVATAEGVRRYERLDDVPTKYAGRMAELVKNQGFETDNLVGYVRQHHDLPPLDWMTLAAFTAIAGAGGLTNTMFSNYCREKGWGMGAHVGAIPSAIGGRTISLSHTGKVFLINGETLVRWRGWLKHIFRDQVAVWMLASFVGMALPCMLSLEYIRNVTVDDSRVAAMTAEGLVRRYPDHASILWTMTLLCGFLVLAPGQISVGDQIARRWTDIVWTSSSSAKRLQGNRVKFVYYGILSAYGVWGLIILCLFPALSIAKIGAVLQNVALGVSSLQAWHTNRTLLPKAIQPHWLLQIGTIFCSVFFLALSAVVAYSLIKS